MTPDPQDSPWIALDGRFGFAWRMLGGTVRSEHRFDPDTGLPDLLDRMRPDPAVPALLCGFDLLPPVQVPARPGALAPAPLAGPAAPVNALALPGLVQLAPRDRMTGAETAIAGFLAMNPGWDGVLCLPGAHTHWAHVSAGEVVSFQSAVTGRLLDTLATGGAAAESFDTAAFAAELDETLSRPERLVTRLNAASVAAALDGATPAQTRARMTGALIGAELAAMRPYWLGQPVAVLAESGAAARPHVTALQAQAVMVTQADGPAMVRAGLTAAMRRLTGTG